MTPPKRQGGKNPHGDEKGSSTAETAGPSETPPSSKPWRGPSVVPLDLADANEMVRRFHRHHAPTSGHKFSVGLESDGEIVGAIIVGRPVTRANDDGRTLEVTRCVVVEGIKNGCSMLYATAWRATRAMGYRRLITYTLTSEPGTTLRAVGWRVVGQTREGKGWDKSNGGGRRRLTKHPLQAKLRWEVTA